MKKMHRISVFYVKKTEAFLFVSELSDNSMHCGVLSSGYKNITSRTHSIDDVGYAKIQKYIIRDEYDLNFRVVQGNLIELYGLINRVLDTNYVFNDQSACIVWVLANRAILHHSLIDRITSMKYPLDPRLPKMGGVADEVLETLNAAMWYLRLNLVDESEIETVIDYARTDMMCKSFTSNGKPEAFTSYYFVEPLLTVLGYKHIIPEGGFRDHSLNHVDYIASIGQEAFLIEVKSFAKKLCGSVESAVFQLYDYMDLAEGCVGIATNGIMWLIIINNPLYDERLENSPRHIHYTVDLSQLALELVSCQHGQLMSNHFEDSKKLVDVFAVEHIADTISYMKSKARKVL